MTDRKIAQYIDFEQKAASKFAWALARQKTVDKEWALYRDDFKRFGPRTKSILAYLIVGAVSALLLPELGLGMLALAVGALTYKLATTAFNYRQAYQTHQFMLDAVPAIISSLFKELDVDCPNQKALKHRAITLRDMLDEMHKADQSNAIAHMTIEYFLGKDSQLDAFYQQQKAKSAAELPAQLIDLLPAKKEVDTLQAAWSQVSRMSTHIDATKLARRLAWDKTFGSDWKAIKEDVKSFGPWKSVGLGVSTIAVGTMGALLVPNVTLVVLQLTLIVGAAVAAHRLIMQMFHFTVIEKAVNGAGLTGQRNLRFLQSELMQEEVPMSVVDVHTSVVALAEPLARLKAVDAQHDLGDDANLEVLLGEQSKLNLLYQQRLHELPSSSGSEQVPQSLMALAAPSPKATI